MTGQGKSSEFAQDLELLLEEVNELLAATEENLVELEKTPNDSALIQEVFRVMHTIKGGAATLGLQEGVDVSHTMETLLDEARSGRRTLDRAFMDALFAAVDYLKDWSAALSEGQEVPSPDDFKARIRKLVGAQAGTGETEGNGSTPTADEAGREDKKDGRPGAKDTPNPPTAAGATGDALPHVEQAQDGKGDLLASKVETALREGKEVMKLSVTFHTDAPLLSVRCFQILTSIEEVAEILGSVPSLDQIERDEVGESLDIYIATDDEGAAAKTIAERSQDVKAVSLTKHEAQKEPGNGKNAKDQNAKDQDLGHRVRRSDLGKTVRVDVGLLDFLMNMVGELVIDRTRLSQIAGELMVEGQTSGIGNEISSLAAHLQRTTSELQAGIMQARLLPLKSILTKFPRMIRDLSQRCGKEIDFQMEGESTEIDRTVLEAIDDPLIHILRNAVDHGIEAPLDRVAAGKSRRGRVTLSASHEENEVLVIVEDDGCGIDAEKIKKSAIKKGLITEEAAAKMTEKEAIEMIFMPGFSTMEVATEVSGRGVGMDVVRTNLERVNGQVEIKTMVGVGTKVTLRLPLTLAIMRALLVKCKDSVFAIPTSSVEEVVAMDDVKVVTVQGKPAMNWRGRVVPVVSLDGALRGDMWSSDGKKYALLTRTNQEPVAFGVDDLMGEEEIVVKEMGRLLSRLKGIAGATILAQGDPAVILDVNRVI